MEMSREMDLSYIITISRDVRDRMKTEYNLIIL